MVKETNKNEKKPLNPVITEEENWKDVLICSNF